MFYFYTIYNKIQIVILNSIYNYCQNKMTNNFQYTQAQPSHNDYKIEC